MKALALDTSISCIQIAAKNDENLASLVLDIGMRQSEKLLPAIEYVMKQADLEPADLDYTVLCEGPGSFTGLRLGFAALKAIELFGGTSANENCSQDRNASTSGDQTASQDRNAGASGDFVPDQKGADPKALQNQKGPASKIPLYGINSLDFLAQPYLDFDGIVLPVIDAHKEKFYAKAFYNGKEIIACDDWDLRALEEKIQKASQDLNASGGSNKILVCGLEAQSFAASCKENGLLNGIKVMAPKGRSANIDSLFILAEEKIARKEPPLADYDGPQYYRASEAEQNAAKN